jgi:hypothetical protein
LEADVVAKSGKAHHPIVTLTGNSDDRISGLVFEITDAELESADAYEVEAYEHVLAPLASGRSAWLYVDVRSSPQARGAVELSTAMVSTKLESEESHSMPSSEPSGLQANLAADSRRRSNEGTS